MASAIPLMQGPVASAIPLMQEPVASAIPLMQGPVANAIPLMQGRWLAPFRSCRRHVLKYWANRARQRESYLSENVQALI